jgi:hypothetical protein
MCVYGVPPRNQNWLKLTFTYFKDLNLIEESDLSEVVADINMYYLFLFFLSNTLMINVSFIFNMQQGNNIFYRLKTLLVSLFLKK